MLLRPETDSRSDTAALSGSFGSYDDVPFEPLTLRFVALPGVQLTYRGQPIAFVDGKATLTIPRAELVLDTPIDELAHDTPSSSYRIGLQQTHANQTRPMEIAITRGGGVSELVDVALAITQGRPLPHEADRRGGVLLLRTMPKPKLHVIEGEGPLRALAAVGVVSAGAVGSATVMKTCRYTGNYTRQYVRADRRLTIFSAATGKPIAERVVHGAVPRDCPITTTTYDGESRSATISIEPSDDDLAAAFRQVVTRLER